MASRDPSDRDSQQPRSLLDRQSDGAESDEAARAWAREFCEDMKRLTAFFESKQK